jgi:phosphatidate phosphatase APP1
MAPLPVPLRRQVRWMLGVLTSLAIVAGTAVFLQTTEPERDERVILFPTVATSTASGFRLPIHGWLFEPERRDVVRGAIIEELRESLELEPGTREAKRFERRARLFLVDDEQGEWVSVEVGSKRVELGPTDDAGHFQGAVELGSKAVNAIRRGRWLTIRAPAAGEHGGASGRVLIPPPGKLAVVSDIDDTVKVTEVEDPKAVLANTFLEPFRAVPGMARAYQRWRQHGATFHFVSGSPWQLYEPLERFLRARGFPRGTFHLRRFRPQGAEALQLFKSPEETKQPAIERLLEALPRRRFILVGDSTERDPEIYGALARSHPERIAHVFIRNVGGAVAHAARYREAFHDVDPGRWTLFDEPRALVEIPVE